MDQQRVALVTGSATGIGRAVAWRFAERGFAVTVNYSKSKDEAEETAEGVRSRGGRAIVVQADVADDMAVRVMVERTVETLRRARRPGQQRGDDPLHPAHRPRRAHRRGLGRHPQRQPEGDVLRLPGGDAALKARRGNIVNIASVAGVAGSGSSIAYAASKGAVITLTKSLAKAFAPEVRVNAVAPGPVQTRWLADHQDMIESAMKLTPLKRPATPDDVAAVVLFLADQTSLMTGQVLVVDGGRTI